MEVKDKAKEGKFRLLIVIIKILLKEQNHF